MNAPIPPIRTTASATNIMMMNGFILSEVSGSADVADEDEPAAGFRNSHAELHGVTGEPLREPASHSSPSSCMPLPHAACDDEELSSDDELLLSSEEEEEELDEDSEEETLESDDELSEEESGLEEKALLREEDVLGMSQSGTKYGPFGSEDGADDATEESTGPLEDAASGTTELRDELLETAAAGITEEEDWVTGCDGAW